MDYSKLRKIIENSNLSITTLFKKLGMSRNSFYYTIEKESLKVATLEKICKILDVSPAIFFTVIASNNVLVEPPVSYGQENTANLELLRAYKRITELQDELAALKDPHKSYKKTKQR